MICCKDEKIRAYYVLPAVVSSFLVSFHFEVVICTEREDVDYGNCQEDEDAKYEMVEVRANNTNHVQQQ